MLLGIKENENVSNTMENRHRGTLEWNGNLCGGKSRTFSTTNPFFCCTIPRTGHILQNRALREK